MAKNKTPVEQELAKLLSVVDPEAIVRVDKVRKLVYIGSEQATPQLLANLKAEAQFFMESHLWKLLHNTPKELAQEAMFVKSETLADLQKGKSMLYTLSVQQNIIDTFKNYGEK